MRTVNMSGANWWLNKGGTNLCILQNKQWHAEFWHPPAVKRHEPRARDHVISSRAPGIQNRKSGRAAAGKGRAPWKKNPVWNRQPWKKEKKQYFNRGNALEREILDSAWSSWAYEWTLYLNSASFYENDEYLRLKLNVSKAWVRERVDHWALKLVSFNPGYKSTSNSTKNTTWNSASVCLWCGTEWLTFVQSCVNIFVCTVHAPTLATGLGLKVLLQRVFRVFWDWLLKLEISSVLVCRKILVSREAPFASFQLPKLKFSCFAIISFGILRPGNRV